MTSSIDHIILSRHHIEISILIFVARISGVIVPRHCAEIFLDVFVVVV